MVKCLMYLGIKIKLSFEFNEKKIEIIINYDK